MYLDEKMEKRRRRSVQICSKLVEAHSSRFIFTSADPYRCRKFLKVVPAGHLSLMIFIYVESILRCYGETLFWLFTASGGEHSESLEMS